MRRNSSVLFGYPAPAAPLRIRRAAAWAGTTVIIFAVAVAGALPLEAGWFTKIVREAGEASGEAGSKAGGLAGRTAARSLKGSLDNAAAHIKRLPGDGKAAVLAVDVTQEGHWRFVNRQGENFTAGTPDELKRAVSTLLPDAAGAPAAGRPLALYLTEDSVFKQRALLGDFPQGAALHVVSGKRSFRLTLTGEGRAARVYGALRPRLVVEMTEKSTFHEALWQLGRPLRRAEVRLLSLEPAVSQEIARLPRVDKALGRAMTDRADPFALARSMSSLRGQTVLITGRIKDAFLYFKPPSGSEGAVRLSQLRKAARDADVNLIVMNTGSSRQPGSRNWLWLRADVKGLDDALKRTTMADFLNALGGRSGMLEVAVKRQGAARVQLTAAAIKTESVLPSTGGITDMVSDMLSQAAGNVVFKSVDASLRSKARQKELDRRIIPGIASGLQFAYLALLLLGLIALPVGRSWWRRVWPLEDRAEYSSRFGYLAAKGVRGVVFIAAFVPISAPLTLPVHIAKRAWHWLTWPLRAWRWVSGGGAADAR